jgi:hypothetical protein
MEAASSADAVLTNTTRLFILLAIYMPCGLIP